MKNRFVLPSALLLACAGLPLGGGAAFGYAGEPGSGDGPNQAYLNLSLSTHHLHLTRALAFCAGLPGRTDVRNPANPLLTEAEAELAEEIGLYDELTDQGTIVGKNPDGTEVGPKWTNITPTDQWRYTLPGPKELGCSEGQTMVYPVREGYQPEDLPPDAFWNPNEGWFTNRFSPWATQFHFPAQDSFADDLATLRAFAMGTSSQLEARSVYGFGPSTSNMWSADCYSQPVKTTLTTGNMTPGSVAALGAYLHALGDRYSHGVCRGNWTDTTPPWYYHNFYTRDEVADGCAFNSHSLEFGCPNSDQRADFVKNAVDGGVEIFNALLQYNSEKYKTQYPARVPSADAHGGWLRRQIQRYAILFETNTSREGGVCRVSFTHALMKACAAAMNTDPASCLADVNVGDGGDCLAVGQTQGCAEGTSYYPVQAACVSSPAAQATAAP